MFKPPSACLAAMLWFPFLRELPPPQSCSTAPGCLSHPNCTAQLTPHWAPWKTSNICNSEAQQNIRGSRWNGLKMLCSWHILKARSWHGCASKRRSANTWGRQYHVVVAAQDAITTITTRAALFWWWSHNSNNSQMNKYTCILSVSSKMWLFFSFFFLNKSFFLKLWKFLNPERKWMHVGFQSLVQTFRSQITWPIRGLINSIHTFPC